MSHLAIIDGKVSMMEWVYIEREQSRGMIESTNVIDVVRWQVGTSSITLCAIRAGGMREMQRR